MEQFRPTGISRTKKKNKYEKKKLWEGDGFDVLFGFLYLLKHHDTICFPFKNIDNRIQSFFIQLKCTSFQNAKRKEDYSLVIPGNSSSLIKNIKQCQRKHRFMAIPVYISFSDCKNIGHMNMLLFDTKTKQIERFESYGKKGFTAKELLPFKWFDEYFNEWLKKSKLSYTYISSQFCPAIGPQEIEEMELNNSRTTAKEHKTDPGGFCAVWSILFIDYRLHYPDLTSKQVMDIILNTLKKYPRSIRTWIRKYSIHLAKQRLSFFNDLEPEVRHSIQDTIWNNKLGDNIIKIFKNRLLDSPKK